MKDEGISTDADRKEDRMAGCKHLQFVTRQEDLNNEASKKHRSIFVMTLFMPVALASDRAFAGNIIANPFAWEENIGWINFSPSQRVLGYP